MTNLSSKATSRPEHELLVLCLAPKRREQRDKRIRELVQQELDWNYLFVLARRHSVVSLVYSRLQETASDLVPTKDLKFLQKYFQENAARNVLLTAELCRLLDVLQTRRIEAIPYKGPALALFAYGDVALRRFVDLDVMVRKEHVEEAIELLLNEGYELSKPLNEGQRNVLLRTQHNVQFRRHNKQLIVELHWEVASHLFASSVQADDLWKNLATVELNSRSIKTLAPEDLLFSLCVHGSRHLWERLLWICDVGWIAVNHDLDWQSLLARAKSTRAERMFLLGLHLSNKLLEVELPEFVKKEIDNDRTLDRLADDIIETLFAQVDHVPATAAQILKYNLRVRRTWRARARYFRQALRPTDRDVDAIALPSSLTFGYYVMRPFRLLRQSVGAFNNDSRSDH